jgi:hypothetical protein
MADIPGTSRAQTSFLRAFRNNPSGPPSQSWPSPSILRRWLRRPRFRAALNSIRSAIQLQSDFHISSAATTAARNLDNPQNPPTPKQLETILRLSHLRQRFTAQSFDHEASETPKTPRDHMLSIPPSQRLTKEEFHDLALRRHYSPPLQSIKGFPAPTPQDTFYYKLLQDPGSLLWWIKLYNYHSTDKRYARLLELCREIVPHHNPAILPFFPDMPQQDPDVLDGSWFKR